MKGLPYLLALILAVPWGAAAEVVNKKLNPTLAGGKGAVSGASRFVDHPFRISPDGKRVVYVADQETDEVFELYSVPIEGGPPVKLSGPLPPGGQVSGAAPEVDHPFRISPDSRRVVYVADQETDEVFELYSVPIEGGSPVKLNPPLAGGAGDVRGAEAEMPAPFLLSPDGKRVVYVADQETDEVFELYSVPIEGGPSVKLNPPLAGGAGDVRGAFGVSPDGRWVVYVADQDFDEVFEIYSVPIGGGDAIQLNRTLVGGAGDVYGVSPVPFRISPDSRRVVYVADFDTDEVFELYSAPIEGGAAVKLNPPLAGGAGDVRGADETSVEAFRISPDGRWVVYLADQEVDEVFELFSVPIEGGRAVKLNPPLAGGRGDVRGAAPEVPNAFLVSPESDRVVYVADQDNDEVFELYAVPIEGGSAVKLNPPMAGGKGDVRGAATGMPNPFRISPDGRWVVYVADQETDTVFELFSVAITGGAATKLNPTLADGRGEVRGADNMVAHPFRISPDSRRVFYLADQEEVGVMELYSVPIGGGAVTKLNSTLAGGRGTIVGADYEMNNPFLVSPDSLTVVYVADQDTDEVIELFVSQLK